MEMAAGEVRHQWNARVGRTVRFRSLEWAQMARATMGPKRHWDRAVNSREVTRKELGEDGRGDGFAG
jgi:hypothetical protein